MDPLHCLLPGAKPDSYEYNCIKEFVTFHHNNPTLYQWLEAKAIAKKKEHRVNFAIQWLVQEARWNWRVTTVRSPGHAKISALHAAFYARLLMFRCAELKGFFHLNPSMADQVDYSKL